MAIVKNQTDCLDCAIMNGQVRFDGFYSTINGVCPKARLWNITGGYGGGGASCGPGGGGGAGFQGIYFIYLCIKKIEGGFGGHKTFGGGGSSAYIPFTNKRLKKELPMWVAGKNAGNGKVSIFSCPQKFCPINSTCQFSSLTIESIEQNPEIFCLCHKNLKKVLLNGTCSGK